MSHRVVTLHKTEKLVAGAALEFKFRPGTTGNMSATADAEENDAVLVLEMFDANGASVGRDDLPSPIVNFQPKAIADFRARVTNRSSTVLTVTLTVQYYSDENLKVETVSTNKISKLSRAVMHELDPRITIEGSQLRITGDASLTEMLKEWTNKKLDLPVEVFGFEADAECLEVTFEAKSDSFPFGAIVLRITCRQPITLRKYLVGKVRIPEPVFVVRAGVSIYGGIHLSPIKVELPAFDTNWAASLGEAIGHVVSDAVAGLDQTIVKLVEDLEKGGALAKITDRIQRALVMKRLANVTVTETGIDLEFDPAPVAVPVPLVAAAPKRKSERLEHLIIVMLENRSFDHMMADIVAGRVDVRRAPDSYSETVGGAVYRRTKTKLDALHEDPPHDSKHQDLQVSKGFVASFLDGHPNSKLGAEVLNYQPREHVPFFDFLAREFVICDDWRASLRGHTWPNRQYSLSGASKRTKKGFRDNPASDEIELYTLPTICDVLEAQHVDWAYYKDDFGFLELYRKWVFDEKRLRSREAFDAAIASGKLPAVSWFEPNISDFGRSKGNDDHPPISVLPGQQLLATLYASLCTLKNPNWLLAITYDEAGGFYDHLSAENTVDDEPEARLQGFRVPAFLVSPWLAAGGVCRTRFDHASLIRSVLDNFCVREPIFDQNNSRVRTAASFAGALDSELSTSAARAMPTFDEVIPEVMDFGVEDGMPEQTPLFSAFEAAKEALREELEGTSVDSFDVMEGEVPPVRFEGLYLETRMLPTELAVAGWKSQPWFDDAIEATPPHPISVDLAWDLVHDLRARHPEIPVIDPLWETAFAANEPDLDSFGIAGGPASTPLWHLDAVKARAAWALPSPSGTQRGEGIIVGHLDTGYRSHPDLDAMLLPAYGWDVYRGDGDPTDDLENGFLKFPGHGTSTGSIIGSRGTDNAEVMGTAPAVQTIPFRISASVVHISMTNMVWGIQLAVERNVHVISLSAGGLWSAALHRAVRDATDAGVIVVAAAGNFTEIVVWPARFDEVISCGATNMTGGTWVWSNGGRGEHVTVMAPGEDVWVLHPNDKTTIVAKPGSGTSFATACVAGAIATWLGFHGRDALIARYGRRNLSHVAKEHLRALTANGNAAGPLDMVRLLEADLPDPILDFDTGPLPPPVDDVASAAASLGLDKAVLELPYADERVFREACVRLANRKSDALSFDTEAHPGLPMSTRLSNSRRRS